MPKEPGKVAQHLRCQDGEGGGGGGDGGDDDGGGGDVPSVPRTTKKLPCPLIWCMIMLGAVAGGE